MVGLLVVGLLDVECYVMPLLAGIRLDVSGESINLACTLGFAMYLPADKNLSLSGFRYESGSERYGQRIYFDAACTMGRR